MAPPLFPELGKDLTAPNSGGASLPNEFERDLTSPAMGMGEDLEPSLGRETELEHLLSRSSRSPGAVLRTLTHEMAMGVAGSGGRHTLGDIPSLAHKASTLLNKPSCC